MLKKLNLQPMGARVLILTLAKNFSESDARE